MANKQVPFDQVLSRLILRLRGLAGGEAPHAEYADDPVRFAREVLGVDLMPHQEAILRDVVGHPRVASPGGHGMGKTWLAAVAILWFLSTRRDALVLSTAPTYFQVDRRLWANLRVLYHNAARPVGGDLLPTAPLLRFGDKWEAIGVSTDRPERFQGGHARNVLIVMTEAQGIPHPIYIAAEAMMINLESRRWLIDGNPTSSAGPFFDACQNPALWRAHHLSCWDHPNIAADRAGKPRPIPDGPTLRWCEQRREEWGEDHPLYISRVLGQFPSEGDELLITVGMLAAALREPAQDALDDGLHLGVDIARHGSDDNVAVLRQNASVRAVHRWRGIDLMSTTGRIVQLMRAEGVRAENVHLDSIGIGAGVVDRLVELGHAVDGVNFASEPAGDWQDTLGDMQFKNRRAELWWTAATLIRTRRAAIPEEHTDLWSDLTSVKYVDPDSAGRTRVEEKERIRKRLGRSPDAGDAYVYSLSRANTGSLISVLGR